jgi:hypothetical protein
MSSDNKIWLSSVGGHRSYARHDPWLECTKKRKTSVTAAILARRLAAKITAATPSFEGLPIFNEGGVSKGSVAT